MAAGIYLHIPFCKSRCSYCDFATDVYRDNDSVERYVAAVCHEIASVKGRPELRAGRFSNSMFVPPAYAGGSADTGDVYDIDTIYLGGGTPSLLKPEQLERILTAVNENFRITSNAEITMEMNPATVSLDSLQDFRECGVNRASFGVQTFDDRSLKLMARGHDANDARETYGMLRETGYENVSFDLIAGLPGQTLGAWERNLDEAVGMQPEHLSLYLLEIHKGTPLAKQIRAGRQPMPDAGLAAEMYELMLDKLSTAGYGQYEISNFARSGHESRHNIKYWTLEPVFGFGVSAHSFDGRQRYANERDTAKYVEMIELDRTAEVMREDTDIASEFVFLGLRLENGIDLGSFENRFGHSLIEKHREDLDGLVTAGLVDVSAATLRLTLKGKLYSNEVFAVFV